MDEEGDDDEMIDEEVDFDVARAAWCVWVERTSSNFH